MQDTNGVKSLDNDNDNGEIFMKQMNRLYNVASYKFSEFIGDIFVAFRRFVVDGLKWKAKKNFLFCRVSWNLVQRYHQHVLETPKSLI